MAGDAKDFSLLMLFLWYSHEVACCAFLGIADRVCRYSDCGRHNRVCIYDYGDPWMVFRTPETFLHSSRLGIRPCLDDPLHPDGTFPVPDSQRWSSYSAGTTGGDPVCRTTPSELCMVMDLFWQARDPVGTYRRSPALCPCCGDHLGIPANIPACRIAARPVPVLGRFCIIVKRNDLVAQLISFKDTQQ